MKRYSIVIPTMGKCEQLLRPCLESIKKYTDLSDGEVIVVSNGSTDNTREYVESFSEPFKLVWEDEAMGYTNATIRGVQESCGQYVILLNNDTALLDQTKNDWVNKLLSPLENNKSVGLTGPMKVVDDHTFREFIIFFCAAFRRTDYDSVGGIDATFNPGFFEDVDFACKIQDWLGKKVVQVPIPSDRYSEHNRMVGDFPIYHQGHATFGELSDEKRSCWYRNEKTIKERYCNIDISRAETCDGYMSTQELRYLAAEAKKHLNILEVGSWHGRSTRALGDNALGIVWAVDHFNGSETEPQNHGSARLENGDHAFMEFMRNNWDLLSVGKVTPLRATSRSMAKELKNLGVKFDMMFIDGGHTYGEVVDDIERWRDLLADGGLFCGHDYGSWEGVTRAVNEMCENVTVAPGTSIWRGTPKRRKVFDCFPFFNELDVLDIRFNVLDDVVDYFVISEGDKTHTGKTKGFNFEENKERFAKFWHKIIYVKADMPEYTGDAWVLERYQRDCLLRGFQGKVTDGDVIMISDCDEIPNPDVVRNYSSAQGLVGLNQKLYYYYLNGYQGSWDQGKILPYTVFKGMTPCQVRYTKGQMIPNGGWHFSYLGGVEKVIEKIESFAHQEYSTDEYKNNVAKNMEQGIDVFGRNSDGKYVELDATFPKYILDNKEKFSHLIKCTS